MCPETIEILGVLGTWFGGLGTFSAVAVALWIALRTSKTKLKCHVGLRVIGGGRNKWECLSFQVTNVGERSASIINVGWRIGRGRNTLRLIQVLGIDSRDKIPKTLSHGESASFWVSTSNLSKWMEEFRGILPKESSIHTLKAEIETSTGHIEIVRPEESFLKALEDISRNAKRQV